MSFVFVERAHANGLGERVKAGMRKPPRARPRLEVSLGAKVIAALGWATGDRVDVAFGDGDDVARMMIERSDEGKYQLFRKGPKSRSDMVSTAYLPPWLSPVPRPAEWCAWALRAGGAHAGALVVTLPRELLDDGSRLGIDRDGWPDGVHFAETDAPDADRWVR